MMLTSSKVMLDSTTDSRRNSHPNSSMLVVGVMNKMVFGIYICMNDANIADYIRSGAIAYARLSVSKKPSFIPSYSPLLRLSYATEYLIN
jgi:hypothetical protein